MNKVCPEANRFVNKLKRVLKESQVSNHLDETALELIKYTYHHYITSTQFLLTHGTTYIITDRYGNSLTKQYPQVKIALDSQIQLTKLIQEFGLTPSSRKRLKDLLKNDEDDSPFTKFMKDKST